MFFDPARKEKKEKERQDKALQAIRAKFPDHRIEYGIKVGNKYVFSLIPPDDPGFGVVLGNFFCVEFTPSAAVSGYSPAFEQDAFNKAIEKPFYSDL